MRAQNLIPADSRLRKLLPFSEAGSYLTALIFVLAALLIRLLLSPFLGSRTPYLVFALAVLAVACVGGRGPGLFATGISALLGRYFFLEPRFSLLDTGLSEAILAGSFVLVGIGITLVSDWLRSARRRAELIAERNRELLERHRYNLEAANAGTFDWNVATNEVVWSNNMESIHGQPPGTVDETLEGFMGLIHPEDREIVQGHIRRAIEGAGNYQVECRYLRADGAVGWLEWKGRVIFDERTARPLRMMGVCIDATQRKRNEQARLQLAAIVDSSEDAIISADLNRVILTWNAAAERMFGYSAQEVKGRSSSLLIPPDRASEEAVLLEKLQRGEHLPSFETVRLHQSGKQIWVSLTLSPIRDDRGAVFAASAILRDISERKMIEEQLRQSAKLESLGVLAGGIAHDFNNLLLGIIGNASLVKDTLPPLSPAHPMLDELLRASQRAANLIQQLLAYSGKGRFVIRPLDLSELARDTVSLVKSSIPKTVSLQLNLATDLPALIADVVQMQQLVMNLVINAAEAIGARSGVVTVTTAVKSLETGC